MKTLSNTKVLFAAGAFGLSLCAPALAQQTVKIGSVTAPASILNVVVSLRNEGVTILLVEQNGTAALEIAHRGYVLESGRIA